MISAVGNHLPNASKASLAARLQHAFSLGAGRFDWQVLASYRSRYYLTPFNELPVTFLDPARPQQTALQATCRT